MLLTVELGLFAKNSESFFISRGCQKGLIHARTANAEKKPHGMSSKLSVVPQREVGVTVFGAAT